MIPAYYPEAAVEYVQWKEICNALRNPSSFTAGEVFAARQFAANALELYIPNPCCVGPNEYGHAPWEEE